MRFLKPRTFAPEQNAVPAPVNTRQRRSGLSENAWTVSMRSSDNCGPRALRVEGSFKVSISTPSSVWRLSRTSLPDALLDAEGSFVDMWLSLENVPDGRMTA